MDYDATNWKCLAAWILVILCETFSFIFAVLSVNLNRRHGDSLHKSPTSSTMSASHEITHARLQGSLL